MARQVEYLEELQIAIRFKYLCEPTHKESVYVHEKTGRGETVWTGYVEVFELAGFKEAKTCYAWLNRKANGVKILTILGNHLIDSAQKAVQAAIFVDAQLAFSTDRDLLNTQLEQAKRKLQETQIKSEDLDAAIKAAEQIKKDIKKRKAEP
jgi:hypothetical protein